MSKKGLSLRQALKREVSERRLYGNTGGNLLILAADIIGNIHPSRRGLFAKDCGLHLSTLERVLNRAGDPDYGPHFRTIERIVIEEKLQFIVFPVDHIDPQFQNKPKEERKGASKKKSKPKLKVVK